MTSGTQTPFLKKAIGMAYLPADRTAAGTEFEIDVRGRRVRAQVVPLPFYKRQRDVDNVHTARRSAEPSGPRDTTMYPADLKYTKDHEWVQLSGGEARVGITDYAQKQLGDVVYLELPEVGRSSRRATSSGRSSRSRPSRSCTRR